MLQSSTSQNYPVHLPSLMSNDLLRYILFSEHHAERTCHFSTHWLAFPHLPELSLASLTTELVPPLNTQPNETRSRAGGHPDGQAFAPTHSGQWTEKGSRRKVGWKWRSALLFFCPLYCGAFFFCFVTLGGVSLVAEEKENTKMHTVLIIHRSSINLTDFLIG